MSLRGMGRRGRMGAGAWIAAGALAATVALAGCASQDPRPPVPEEQKKVVGVGADGSDPQQAVLAEIYAGALDRRGREANVVADVPAEMLVQTVRSGEATLAFGCTGELLGALDPVTARALAEEFIADDDPGKALSATWRDRVYGAMSEALPGELMATDPSNAQGCGMEDGRTDAEWRQLEGGVADSPGAVLPQHVVPFYLKPTLTRAERTDVLNRVAGSLTSEDLEELTAKVAAGQEPAGVAAQWLDTSRFATG